MKISHSRAIEHGKKSMFFGFWFFGFLGVFLVFCLFGFVFVLGTDLESPSLLASLYRVESLNNLIDRPTTI